MSDFQGWGAVARSLHDLAGITKGEWLNEGQRRSLRAIAQRIPKNGLIIADEVGMGKTRVAVALAHCVTRNGGRVAVLVPPGLGYQWRAEMRGMDITPSEFLRSLWGYFEAWSSEEKEEWRPWFEEEVVIISHGFANWRLGDGSAMWRMALVPELVARWRSLLGGRLPRGYHQHDGLKDLWVQRAGETIAQHVHGTECDPLRSTLMSLYEDNAWDLNRLFDGTLYSRHGELRNKLEKAVGIGLGSFDLIIVDEAHKSRGEDSGLSHLLGNVLLRNSKSRCVSMTATPVELDVSQWDSMLRRIGLEQEAVEDIRIQALEPYLDSVRVLGRAWRSDPESRTRFHAAAKRYQWSLSPYLIRRDKREEPVIKAFRARTDGRHGEDYRRRTEVAIEPEGHNWREALYVAEALSLMGHCDSDIMEKRLRLTMGNGHGIAAFLDQVHAEPEDEDFNPQEDRDDSTDAVRKDKRRQRAKWWKDRLFTLLKDDGSLLEHPAIVKAVEVIEGEVEKGEKVLVFGRFTQPMLALQRLLNARAMLRALEQGDPWPQSKVHVEDDNDPISERKAIQVAHRQLNSSLNLEELNDQLARQYRQLEQQRERLREKIPELLARGLEQRKRESCSPFLDAMVSQLGATEKHIPELARALVEYIDDEDDELEDASPGTLLTAFESLLNDMLDEQERDDKEFQVSTDAEEVWERFKERLVDEFFGQQGKFARMMYGGTAMQTRRYLQSAFNREKSATRVLIAQSMVGREGLNLHQACRTVLLLHPEWNPGVVEQQIGRVDRVGSRWERLFRETTQDVSIEDLPRIEIKALVFRGTYDEHNWEVLKTRWDALRSQLHGEVIMAEGDIEDSESEAILREISAYAPSFSPPL